MTRFERNAEKLYNAFNSGTLNAFKCSACAVGNIVGHGEWSGYVGNDVLYGIFKRSSRCDNDYPNNEDYSKEELKEIEFRFLNAWNGDVRLKGYDKELQFKGLMAVLEYLAELDGVSTIESQYNKFKEVLNKESEKVCS